MSVKIALLDARTAAKGSAVLLAAHRTVAIARSHEGTLDLELDPAAQAASMKHRHIRPPLLTLSVTIALLPDTRASLCIPKEVPDDPRFD